MICDGAKRIPEDNPIATLSDIGVTARELHDARIVRDAEREKPGIVHETHPPKGIAHYG